MNTKKMVEKFGAFGVLLNAVSMVVDDLTWKEKLTENERYLLEAWEEFKKKNRSMKRYCNTCKTQTVHRELKQYSNSQGTIHFRSYECLTCGRKEQERVTFPCGRCGTALTIDEWEDGGYCTPCQEEWRSMGGL